MNRKPLAAGIGGGALVLLATFFGTRRGRQLKQLGNGFLLWLEAVNRDANTDTAAVKPKVLSALTPYDNDAVDDIDSLAKFRSLVTDAGHRHTLVNAFAESDRRTLTDAERAYLVHGNRAALRVKAGRAPVATDTHRLPDDSSGTKVDPDIQTEVDSTVGQVN